MHVSACCLVMCVAHLRIHEIWLEPSCESMTDACRVSPAEQNRVSSHQQSRIACCKLTDLCNKVPQAGERRGPHTENPLFQALKGVGLRTYTAIQLCVPQGSILCEA